MKALRRTAVAIFGGAAALALTVGFGGIDLSPAGSASATPTHASSSVTQARPNAATPAPDAGVHTATLTGCIAGLDC